uniref:Uncharacterized protein n=1 Tax=Anguilla anguilla TaxID=7936 RepID=A0A0E9S0W5_ANGAN
MGSKSRSDSQTTYPKCGLCPGCLSGEC